MPNPNPNPNRMTISIQCLGKLTVLSRWNGGSLQLTEVPFSFVTLTKLHQIDLERNRLVRLPELHRLPATSSNINDVRLGWNRLDASALDGLFRLTKLHMLLLNNNLLTKIPPGIFDLTNLHHLRLGGNLLTTVDPGLARLTKLRYLELSGNAPLDSVAPEVWRMPSLNALFASDMMGTTAVTEALEAHLAGSMSAKLKFVDLSGNTFGSSAAYPLHGWPGATTWARSQLASSGAPIGDVIKYDNEQWFKRSMVPRVVLLSRSSLCVEGTGTMVATTNNTADWSYVCSNDKYERSGAPNISASLWKATNSAAGNGFVQCRCPSGTTWWVPARSRCWIKTAEIPCEGGIIVSNCSDADGGGEAYGVKCE